MLLGPSTTTDTAYVQPTRWTFNMCIINITYPYMPHGVTLTVRGIRQVHPSACVDNTAYQWLHFHYIVCDWVSAVPILFIVTPGHAHVLCSTLRNWVHPLETPGTTSLVSRGSCKPMHKYPPLHWGEHLPGEIVPVFPQPTEPHSQLFHLGSWLKCGHVYSQL